mgnify:CR=1 FL=1
MIISNIITYLTWFNNCDKYSLLNEVTFHPKNIVKLKAYLKITKMLEIARGKHSFSMRSQSKADALKFYKAQNNPYKIELIDSKIEKFFKDKWKNNFFKIFFVYQI